ncbi:hypothetical protein SVEN_0374 [Streptomyces venezuelae ATCC 10712]|uniref:Uncharacterized protein n=1 Tax=Streptomyces venezuelae (strain ATCC 10712 / CBS 650.69 / DSM 40230 / JCM 4526 / NBRC 13096 / PD 04745) TaxID=953739 RepID=F2R600_STRVP|nr:hypothetical protein SVEN_0374 [Streptomyces venezuelae ATCC 10712]
MCPRQTWNFVRTDRAIRRARGCGTAATGNTERQKRSPACPRPAAPTLDSEESPVSTLLTRIKRFAHSPQGRSAAASVRRAAADPRRRSQVMRFLSKVRGHR